MKEDILEVEEWELGEYFVGVTVRNRMTNLRWKTGTVYGPANHDHSESFLKEIEGLIKKSVLPVVIGGIST